MSPYSVIELRLLILFKTRMGGVSDGRLQRATLLDEQLKLESVPHEDEGGARSASPGGSAYLPDATSRENSLCAGRSGCSTATLLPDGTLLNVFISAPATRLERLQTLTAPNELDSLCFSRGLKRFPMPGESNSVKNAGQAFLPDGAAREIERTLQNRFMDYSRASFKRSHALSFVHASRLSSFSVRFQRKEPL